MSHLVNSINKTITLQNKLPFSVYSSVKEQRLLNVPIIKPTLIVVLKGSKALGKRHELACHAGQFIFLANSPAINMRNIPQNKTYFALIIEFELQEISDLRIDDGKGSDYLIGQTSASLEACLQQFVEAARWAPDNICALRKREILLLLSALGHQGVLSLLGSVQTKDTLHTMFTTQGFHITTKQICQQLAMSESTLRRKLALEGTSVLEIKDQARLGLALHLLQTTRDSIGFIADKCGYQSQSRFTTRFKNRFGLTPSALRKTKMTD